MSQVVAIRDRTTTYVRGCEQSGVRHGLTRDISQGAFVALIGIDNFLAPHSP